MEEYHKINTVFKRDPANKNRTLLEGEYSIPEFEYLKDNMWMFTEKVDGTNIRVMHNGCGGLKFGGKTDTAQIPALLVNRLNDLFLTQVDLFDEKFSDGVCLYGEGYGAKIQKGGGNYLDHQDFVLFDVKIGDWWLKRSDVKDVAESLGIKQVPVVMKGTLDDMVTMVSVGFDSKWGAFKAEGLVGRPLVELTARNGERIITKLKTKDFIQS